jgi:hypothetical protein
LAIFELGIIKNGILIFSKVFYPLDANMKRGGNDQNLRSQMLSSIIHFANNCLSTDVENFTMREYQIAIASQQVIARGRKNFVVAYIIGDNNLGLDIASESLKQTLRMFIIMYQDQWNIVEDTSKYAMFDKALAEIFGDLHYRPLDRVRRLFVT